MKPITHSEGKQGPFLDQRLLHKNEEKEVFLTFCNSFDAKEYSAHALFHEHHYYNDHTGPLTDLMHLLECARQAETYIVHKYEHQPLGTRFILTEWSCNFKENYIPTTFLLNSSVVLNVVTSNKRLTKGKLLSQLYDIKIYKEKLHIANVHMSVRYMTDEAYFIVRKGKIKNHSTKLVMLYEEDLKISPESIFRRGKDNVVIYAPVYTKNGVVSKLAVNRGNTAYFDHIQDHYPAMVLMEAGKQNCQLWINKFQAGSFPVLIEMKSKFFIYAELDKDVKVISFKRSGTSDKKVIFDVNLQQGELDVAEMQYTFEVFN
ncbi:AfsA-related hotdog domain-containing protein [Pantoea brenneri]|uniref:AfsA-related hotdog domain-containing protein n=1 Tax=Pantoea brenneri TaxID=472694 RepID=UPI00289E7D38|nr:AfsA-related hotdog domain-containing protein [Pantoea brenneri]